MITCKNCGCKIQEGQRVCPYCGAPVVKNAKTSRSASAALSNSSPKAAGSSETRQKSSDRTVTMYQGDEVTQMMRKARRRDLLAEAVEELRKAYVQRVVLMALLAGSLVFELLILIVVLGH